MYYTHTYIPPISIWINLYIKVCVYEIEVCERVCIYLCVTYNMNVCMHIYIQVCGILYRCTSL